jgi:hypothetical protein
MLLKIAIAPSQGEGLLALARPIEAHASEALDAGWGSVGVAPEATVAMQLQTSSGCPIR